MGSVPNYNIVKSACKKRLMDLGMDQGTAHVLARGRRFWLPYGDRKPIIETDWEELYNIFIQGAFPMGFDVDKSIKKSHKRGFMDVLSVMQQQLRRFAEMKLAEGAFSEGLGGNLGRCWIGSID